MCARHAPRAGPNHKRWGKLPWRDLVAPAIGLATDGFAIDAALSVDLGAMSARSTTSPEFRRVFMPPDGIKWHAGDRLAAPDLARTLQLLADVGPDAFYAGSIAQSIVAEMQAGGGLITADDLSSYTAKIWRQRTVLIRGFDIFGPPPPSSGGTCLVEMLNILENFDLVPGIELPRGPCI